jgi:hypothetical protein
VAEAPPDCRVGGRFLACERTWLSVRSLTPEPYEHHRLLCRRVHNDVTTSDAASAEICATASSTGMASHVFTAPTGAQYQRHQDRVPDLGNGSQSKAGELRLDATPSGAGDRGYAPDPISETKKIPEKRSLLLFLSFRFLFFFDFCGVANRRSTSQQPCNNVAANQQRAARAGKSMGRCCSRA